MELKCGLIMFSIFIRSGPSLKNFFFIKLSIKIRNEMVFIINKSIDINVKPTQSFISITVT